MVDLSEKRSSTMEMGNKNPDGVSSDESQNSEIKRCADCGTSKTPLWRGGPLGPKSLCNACGIRSRKKRRAVSEFQTDEKRPKKANSIHSGSGGSNTSSKLRSPLHRRLVALGREVMMQRSTADNKPHRRKLGEEEQAAVLLMALSYGSVFA